MIRSSIAVLMGVVALSSLGLAALRNPTEVMASVVYSVLVVVLLAGGFGAATSRGRRRRFWAMFAACGTVHLALTLLPGPMPQLPTIDLIEWIYREYEDYHPSITLYTNSDTMFQVYASDGSQYIRVRNGPGSNQLSFIPLPSFLISVHLATLAVAVLGGGLAALAPIAPRSGDAACRDAPRAGDR